MSTKIFVGSLPSGSKPEELRHLFEGFGVVTECDVMNRCGFVHMEKPEMAETAIKALNGTEFKGETINVEPGRVRDRNQKPGGIGGPKGGGPRQRGGRNTNGMGRMPNFEGIEEAAMDLDGIDERTTKDALQLCSAVFEEMNKLLNPDQMVGPRRGGGGMGFPDNFVEEQFGPMLGGMGGPRGPMNRGPRNNRNGPPNQGPIPGLGAMQGAHNRPPMRNNANQGPRGAPAIQAARAAPANQAPRGPPANQGNRGPKQGPAQSGPQGRGQNQGNAGPQGSQGFAGRNQGNAGRVPKQGNVGPIRNEPARQQRAVAPYNRGGVGPVDNGINFADDVPIVQSARNFADSLATGSQIDRWQANGGNFGGSGGRNIHPMNRNFDEDMPVDNFNDDPPVVINMVVRPNAASGMGGAIGRRGGMGNQGPVNQGNFGHSTGGGNDRFQGSNDNFQAGNNRFQGGNDRFQGGNDRFQGGNNDRFQGGNNDRFQGGNNDRFQNNINNDRFQGGNIGGGGAGATPGNFGNQDRRGFVLPEQEIFNDSPKFGNKDLRSGGISQFSGQNNQGNMGGSNRNAGFGNNNAARQQNVPEARNLGGGGGNMGANSANAMFSRRVNNAGGNLGGNNMGSRNDVPDTNLGGNFGGNNNRGMGGGGGGGIGSAGGNMNANNAGFNRNNNMSGGNSNLNGPIRGNNRNMGGNSALNNRNIGGLAPNNSNRNMGGGMGNNNNNNRNMGGNAGNNMNRNNMGGGNQMNSNFQKDFPALPGGQNMNNRNGPRQNMMSNRRY